MLSSHKFWQHGKTSSLIGQSYSKAMKRRKAGEKETFG